MEIDSYDRGSFDRDDEGGVLGDQFLLPDIAESAQADALEADLSELAEKSQAEPWQPATPVAECCCSTPALDPADSAAQASIGFPEADGSVTPVAAQDSNGDGIPDVAVFDFDRDNVPDAWALDSTGTRQADLLLFDTTGDGLADSASYWSLEDGWSASAPLAQPAPPMGSTGGWVVMPSSGERAGGPLPGEPGLTAPLQPPQSFLAPDPTQDTDGDGSPDTQDARPNDRFDSTTGDSDADGQPDAFDNQPTTPYDSTTRDADGDSTADRFDNQPTNHDD